MAFVSVKPGTLLAPVPVALIGSGAESAEGQPIRNLMTAAADLGVASCWIHRAKEVFESEEGKDIWEDWIRSGACDDEINDERYYVFQEDEPLGDDGILEILEY